MLPAQPCPPTASNFPFQPAAGSQISIVIAHLAVGLAIATTRQNSGNSEKGAEDAPLLRPRPDAGGRNVPGVMDSASVTVVFGSATPVNSWHAAAPADFGTSTVSRSIPAPTQPVF